MDGSTEARATEVLLGFFEEMHRLGLDGVRYIRSVDPEEGVDIDELARVRAVERKRLEDIFQRYCLEGLNAERLKSPVMSHRDPPRYDPDHEAIMSVATAGDVVVIETYEDVEVGWCYRYELARRGDRFFIKDNKQFRLEAAPEWKPHIL